MKNVLFPIWDKFDRFLCHALVPSSIRLWWRGLWDRKNKFHPCYDRDLNATEKMSPEKSRAYTHRLVTRKNRVRNAKADQPLIQ